MQKVAIITHANSREAMLEKLYDEGLVEVTSSGQGVAIDHSEVSYRIADVDFAINTLTGSASKETKAAANRKVTADEIVKTTNTTDVLGIVQDLRDLEASDTQAQANLQEATSTQESLQPWQQLTHNLSTIRNSKYVDVLLGFVPKESAAAVYDIVTNQFAKIDLLEAMTDDKHTWFAATIWKEDAAAFEEAVTTLGWTEAPIPIADGNAKTLTEEATMQLKEAEKVMTENAAKRGQLSVELPKLVQVRQFMRWLEDKQAVREALSNTETTSTIFGWMPKKKVDLLETHLQKVDPAVAMLKVKPDEGEEPPVLLHNSKWIKPFHSVTALYGLPKHTEMDPTAALSPFFILYFALCLTDAGYGAIIAIVTGIIIWKTKFKIDDSPLLWLLFMGGIMTFIIGILFGGWLGFTPDQAPAIFTRQGPEGLLFKGQIWNLSLQSGITFLQNLSLFFGVLQVFFGIFLAGYYKWVHGKKSEAMWKDFTSHLVLGTVILMVVAPVEYAELAKWGVYASVTLLVWGKGYGHKWYVRPFIGLIGLLDFAMSMLSNILSFLRIMALGLVTGALAMAVNQMSVEMGKLFPIWLAIPLIICLFIGGHTVSIALNTLGSFIHSARLQFIEFFSQFFEGGGSGFKPFKRTTS